MQFITIKFLCVIFIMHNVCAMDNQLNNFKAPSNVPIMQEHDSMLSSYIADRPSRKDCDYLKGQFKALKAGVGAFAIGAMLGCCGAERSVECIVHAASAYCGCPLTIERCNHCFTVGQWMLQVGGLVVSGSSYYEIKTKRDSKRTPCNLSNDMKIE